MYAVTPATNNQSTFTVYQINEDNGQLTQVTTATIPVRAAQNMAVDSTGKNFYVTGLEAPGTNMDLVKIDPEHARDHADARADVSHAACICERR